MQSLSVLPQASVSRVRFAQPARAPSRRAKISTKAVDSGAALAVTQQATAYAVLIAAEGFYTSEQLPAGAAGRPELKVVGASAGGVMLAVLLLQVDYLRIPASLVGLGVSLWLLYLYVRRTLDTKGDSMEWPGPKAWPGGMALVSFLASSVFLQSLLNR